MTDIRVDPAEPLTVEAKFDTPLRINADFLVKRAGSDDWRTFYSASVSQDVPSQLVRTTVDPLKPGSELLLTAVYAGAKHTAYRCTFRLLQKGSPISDDIVVTGSTGTRFASYEEVGVKLV